MSLLLHYLFCIEGVIGSINYFFFKKKTRLFTCVTCDRTRRLSWDDAGDRFCSLLHSRWFSRKVGRNWVGSFVSTHFTCTDVTHLLHSPAPMPPPVMWILSVRWRKRSRGTVERQHSADESEDFKALWHFLTLPPRQARQVRPWWRFKVINGHSVLQLQRSHFFFLNACCVCRHSCANYTHENKLKMIKSEFWKKKSCRTLFINTTDWTGAMTCFHNSPAVGFSVTSLQQVSGAKCGNFWCKICYTHFCFFTSSLLFLPKKLKLSKPPLVCYKNMCLHQLHKSPYCDIKRGIAK